ncbi:MAG TPA: hypothetical protein VJR23_10315 [Candidatus Acidoferrales bacterium]|nr:hypothetical protein [Candidatus Acidoferrales bacterium]
MRNKVVHFFLFALLFFGVSVSTSAGVRVVVTIAPPPLPVYVQPACPGDGYIWVPGYWDWDEDYDDYYWVPGTWVLAPEAGYLWTPGYWGWDGDGYVFYDGYWGPSVGFYGGIDYGFGYFGVGYVGGRWDGDRFYYNREVSNVNVTIVHNVYRESVTNVTVNHVSYNGGSGGIVARANAQEEAAAHGRHRGPVDAQTQQRQLARGNSDLRASFNRGKPPVAATPRPGEFEGHGVEGAKKAGAPYHPSERPANAGGHANVNANANNRVEPSQPRSEPVHARDLPPVSRPTAPDTGNPKLDQKYEKQQQKMIAQQEKARQKLEQQQMKQDQKLARQNADQQRKQQMEQRHQQQTQHLAQRQSRQVQHMQQRQQPPRPPQPHKPPHR